MARKPLDDVPHDIVDRMSRDLTSIALDVADRHLVPALRVMNGRCKTEPETTCFDEVVGVAVKTMFTTGMGVTMEYLYSPEQVELPGWHHISHPILGALIGVEQSTISHSKARTENRRLTRELAKKHLTARSL